MSNSNEASLSDKFASEVFAGLVAPALHGLHVSNLLAVNLPINEDVMVRLERELKIALAKPASERRWVMVIDLRKCVGCTSCTVACIAENKLPPGVVYRPVLVQEIGTYPNTTMQFLPRPCMQCDQPPCTEVCPVTATYKDEEGVIVIDYDQCIGCRSCIAACPYGARTFDLGQTYLQNTPDKVNSILGQSNANGYEVLADYEYSEPRVRQGRSSPIGNARKCHFCEQRIKEGILPACTTTCIGRATYFGDANDPGSLVSELISGNNVMRLREELGTEPRVYYLV
jgi:Fe-S-cluster-containing dehydrogenase component